jgi:uncharacterized protein
MVVEKVQSRIVVFLLIAFGISAIFYALIIACGHVAGADGMYVTGLMWAPATAAILTCRLTGKPLSELGWGWGRWRYNWIAYLLPLAYAGIAYVIVWVSGMGHFGNPSFLAQMSKSLGWPSASPWLIVAGSLLIFGTIGMVSSVATGLGEELGWRGFLTPEMTRAYGFTRGTVLTGMIWTVWHLPIILFADYNSATPVWFSIACFAVMVMALSFAFAWLRLRSGSVWPAAILHGSHNLFIQVWLTPITAPSGRITPYAIDEFGFMLPLACIVMAVAFWRMRGSTQRAP